MDESQPPPEPYPFLPTSELAEPILLAPGEGVKVGVMGTSATFKVLPEQTGGAYALLEQRVAPGVGPPLHVHRRETEIFYILEGEFELTIGERRVRPLPGATFVGPRDIPHTFCNVGSTEGRFLLWIVPGQFANYFRETDESTKPDADMIRVLSEQYGVEILA